MIEITCTVYRSIHADCCTVIENQTGLRYSVNLSPFSAPDEPLCNCGVDNCIHVNACKEVLKEVVRAAF